MALYYLGIRVREAVLKLPSTAAQPQMVLHTSTHTMTLPYPLRSQTGWRRLEETSFYTFFFSKLQYYFGHSDQMA